jgi:carbon storage regulator
MLVFQRKAGESIKIGDNTTIIILETRLNYMRIGIEAPPEIPVYRGEVYEELKKQGPVRSLAGDKQEIRVKSALFWIKPDGTYLHIWWDGGNWRVPTEKFQGKSPEEVATYLDEHRICSSCGVELQNNEAAGEHFAGHYCGTCWEKYKAKNNRRCGTCGRPLYECTC